VRERVREKDKERERERKTEREGGEREKARCQDLQISSGFDFCFHRGAIRTFS